MQFKENLAAKLQGIQDKGFMTSAFVGAMTTKMDSIFLINPSETSEALPSSVTEAQVIGDFCFFNGHLLRVLQGEPFYDPLMKELMIQSSDYLRQWILMRELYRGEKDYNVLVNAYHSKLTETGKIVEAKAEKAFLPDQLPEYLSQLKKILDIATPHTDPKFRKSILGMFYVGDRMVNPDNLNKPISPQRIANVITASSFRNTSLENIHAQETKASVISFGKVRSESDYRLKNWLILMDDLGNSPLLPLIVNMYRELHCDTWQE